jgi:hypothetical protein
MKAKIYKPAKTAMQSGSIAKDYWLLEFLPQTQKYVEPLMGWVGSTDTQQQLRIKFPTRDKAIAYAQSKSYEFEVIEPKPRKFIKKSYADNFKFEG